MAESYDHLAGTEQDVRSHPDRNMPENEDSWGERTQSYDMLSNRISDYRATKQKVFKGHNSESAE